MRTKPKMTKAELTKRVNEEAKAMIAEIKRQGGRMTLTECKNEARRVFLEEFEII